MLKIFASFYLRLCFGTCYNIYNIEFYVLLTVRPGITLDK